MDLNIVSPINQLGYGIAGTNITKELAKENNVSLWIIGGAEVKDQATADILRQCIENSRSFNYNAPCIKIWHQHDMAQMAGRGPRIGFPFFELDTFSDVEKHNLMSLDKIFVSCQWAKDVCLKNLNISEDKVCIVPLGVDSTVFKPTFFQNKEQTIFFNCGKWEIRKGHDILVHIFNKAFTESDNVELWMMCDNPFLPDGEKEAWENAYKSSKLGSKIKIIHRCETQEQVYNTMKNVDCGIFPSRAEGWNLELLELMSCGKQVITTNYSAHTEYCNESNSYLVPIKSLEKASDGKWFFGQGNWAKIFEDEIDMFVEHMRHVHKNKSMNKSGIETAKKFSWSNSAQEVIKHVQLF